MMFTMALVIFLHLNSLVFDLGNFVWEIWWKKIFDGLKFELEIFFKDKNLKVLVGLKKIILKKSFSSFFYILNRKKYQNDAFFVHLTVQHVFLKKKKTVQYGWR